MQVVVKAIWQAERRKYATFSLGKIGVFRPDLQAKMGGFLLASITGESHPGEARGTFQLVPIRMLEATEKPIRLPVGLYVETVIGGVVLVSPNFSADDTRFILTHEARQQLKAKYPATYAVIVGSVSATGWQPMPTPTGDAK